MIAKTPPAPYYAVIFTSTRREGDHGYAAMSELITDLATRQPGYLGVESARNELGITVSYWDSLESVKSWKENMQHQGAQRLGKERWYGEYMIRICKVERDYGFDSNAQDTE